MPNKNQTQLRKEDIKMEKKTNPRITLYYINRLEEVDGYDLTSKAEDYSVETTPETHEKDLFTAFYSIEFYDTQLAEIVDELTETTYYFHDDAFTGEKNLFRTKSKLKSFLKEKYDMRVKG